MNKRLVVSFGLIIATLLVGRMFGFTWAGGDGFVRPLKVGVEEIVGGATADRNGTIRRLATFEGIKRGEIVRTGDGERVVLRIGFAHELFLDERTDVRLDDLTPDHLTIKLIRGRVLLDTHQTDDHNGDAFGLPTITTNHTETTILYGKLSVVNYDFKETVEIIPIETVAAVMVGDGQGSITESPIIVHETDPVSVTDSTFDPVTSSAAEFYQWSMMAPPSISSPS